MLTIKQLADYVGVTVKAVRHYHRIGLLPEPERDALGYRSYLAEDVIALQRIKVLTDAGVPLARVRELLDADGETFASAQQEIDASLRSRIRELNQARRRLRALVTEKDPFLPEPLRRLLSKYAVLNLPKNIERLNRDGWLLASIIFPDSIAEWAALCEEFLDDPEYRALFLETVEAREWDPDDPRLEDLADRTVTWTSRYSWATSDAQRTDSLGFELVRAFGDPTPAEARLIQLVEARLRRLAAERYCVNE